ncbi:NADH-quinone oxidoreductase subunit A [Actinospongicola halichondriae]|uniref:NADH-quinone oxidoreductase subunit A n=1 Tax=Actinospongicola halichondriae TaxID=3236844 RepID=UPI003D4EF5BD
MLGQYLPLAVLLILAGVFVAGSFATRKLLATNKMTEAKLAPYECGIVPTKEPPERFPVKFYLVAMSFIVFDIEIIFLYPWATIYRRLGPYGLFAVALFSAPIIVSLAYEFSKGALDWGPAKSDERSTMQSPDRTSTSTVRRVGLDGRLAAGSTPGATEAA